jgi:hypothetical protein
MDFSKNVAFIDKINGSMIQIMKDGKIDKNDIPTIVLLIMDLIASSNTVKRDPITTEQIEESINNLYNYIMGHYKLFPEDSVQKAEFKVMFDICVKLALFQPNINNKAKKLFACLR